MHLPNARARRHPRRRSLWRRRVAALSILVASGLIAPVDRAEAANRAHEKEALALIYEAADRICGSVERSGSSRQFALTGSAKADNAILMYTGLPDPLEFFQPAQVTAVNGTAVSGTAGPGSPCPNCVIELFLDDTDAITEALQSLVVVTAAADGTWSATLPAPLTASQGIRTTSTTAQYNTIPNISAGTTVGLSPLYPLAPPEEEYWIYLPSISR